MIVELLNKYSVLKIKTMKKILLFALISQCVFSQVGIGNTNPKGALDLRGNITKDLGLVLPETSNVNNVKTPDGTAVLEGTVVWDNQEKCMKFKTPTAWSKCIPTKDDIIDPSVIDGIKSITADGKSPIRVKRDAKGDPMFSTAQGGLMFINNQNSNLYGGGKNNVDYPPLTREVGSNINPVFISNTKFVSHSIGGYDSNNDQYLYSIGVTAEGKVFVTGSNYYGQLGTGNREKVLTYKDVTNLIQGLAADEKIVKVIAGAANAILLSSKGNVFAAGMNQYGGNANGLNSDSFQTTFKKAMFRTDDQTSDADKKITDVFVSSTSVNCFTAVSSTNKVFAWGRLYGSGLLSAKPNTGNYDGNFGTDAVSAGNTEHTTYMTNVTKTFEGSGNILPMNKVRKFITTTSVSYLLLEDGRLFAVGYLNNINKPALPAETNEYTTSPILMNSVLFPQANYQNNSIIADTHKVIDVTYSVLEHVNGFSNWFYVYGADLFSPNNYYSGFQNGQAYSMIITKNELFYKGTNFKLEDQYGARLGNKFANIRANDWTKFDKAGSEMAEYEFVAVNIDVKKSVIAVKKPSETLADGVRLFAAGDADDGDAGSTVKDSQSALVFKPVTY